jgi:hypothetical protein
MLSWGGITFPNCSYKAGIYTGIALQVVAMIAEPFLAPELEAEAAAAGAEGRAARGAKAETGASGGAREAGYHGPGGGGEGTAGGTAADANRGYHVTGDGVAIPPDPKYDIPAHYVENPNRSGSYGEIVNGRFRERIRIDPPTPPGTSGPNYSHYHLNGSKTHHAPRPGKADPGFK